MTSLCETVRAGVEAALPPGVLLGLALGGSYGRGEGSVLSTPQGDRPYNDVEFYVFVRGQAALADRRYRKSLKQLGTRLSPEWGVEIELKPVTPSQLRDSAPTIFYYDLLMGHRWVVGDDALLAGCDHHRQAADLPLCEATRLLMNRCSGLLFSAARLRSGNFTPADADFVTRNLAKAQLAFGDVLLTTCGQYHWSCQERQRRLQALQPSESLPWLEAVRHFHDAGLQFKLHPFLSNEPRVLLDEQYAEVASLARQVWLWLESKRLGTRFGSIASYSLSKTNKCPETFSLRNALVNLNAFGLAALRSPRRLIRNPRQRLLETLPLLLWQEKRDHASLKKVQRELSCQANDFTSLAAAYESLWGRFN